MNLKELTEEQSFTYRVTKDQKVFISYEGKQVMVVTKNRARELIEDLEFADEEEEQHLLARITGNFKRGHEREAKLKDKYS